MKIVIAGSYDQYLNYLRKSGETPETARYASEERQIAGLHDVEVVTFGSWWNNPLCESDVLRSIVQVRKE